MPLGHLALIWQTTGNVIVNQNYDAINKSLSIMK